MTDYAVTTQDLTSKFSFVNMKQLMGYLATYNMATQTLAPDANVYDIQSTGTGYMMFNGQIELCDADAALDISADTEGTETAWATATSYSVGYIRANKDGIRFRCTVAHTSTASDEPMYGGNWEDYWEEAPHNAENAAGLSIADGSAAWLMVTAKKDGTLTVWKAGDVESGTTPEMKIPQYDPKTYCVLGFILYANSAGDSAADVIGNTSTCDFSTYGTFVQQIGPVFPHADNWLKN